MANFLYIFICEHFQDNKFVWICCFLKMCTHYQSYFFVNTILTVLGFPDGSVVKNLPETGAYYTEWSKPEGKTPK